MTTRYNNEIHRFRLGDPRDVITVPQGRILVADCYLSQVLVMSRDGDEVSQLIQEKQLQNPWCLSLDSDHDRLYVSGRDHDGKHHIFVYGYNLHTHDEMPTGNTTLL